MPRDGGSHRGDSYRTSSYPPIDDDGDGDVTMSDGSRLYPQVCAALVACLGAFLMGTGIGWSAPALNQLRDNTTVQPFPCTDTDANWIGSLTPAGALFGSLMGGVLCDRYGRKGVMYLSAMGFALGYALLVGANGVTMLCFGRLITGVGCGLVTTSCPTYIAEISSPKIRGILGSMFQLFVTVGVLWTSVIGAAVTWRWLSVSVIVFDVLWVILVVIIPNSPTYLLSKQQFEGARSALQKLRGTERIEAELSEAQNNVLEAARGASGGVRDLLKTETLKPLSISVFLMFGQQFSGVNAVIFYAVDIFKAAGSSISPFVENVILNIVQVLITSFSTLIIDRSGRKVLLISSATTMCLTISGLGAYFYVQAHDPAAAAKITFLPIGCLCVFIAAFSLGYGGIPWLMMSELMAPEVKSISNSIAAGANWIMAFLITRFYGDAAAQLGKPATFWAFGVFSLIQVVGVAAFVPETKGRTLDEIQQLFRRRDVTDSGGSGRVFGGDADRIIDNEEVFPEAEEDEDLDDRLAVNA